MSANEAIKEGSDCLIIGRLLQKAIQRKYKKHTFIHKVDEI